MKKIYYLAFALLVTSFILSACGKEIDAETGKEITRLKPVPLDLSNPASEKCTKNGGTVKMQGEVGICKFQDGSECEEWAFFRGQCSPKTIMKKETDPSANIPCDDTDKPVCAKIQVQCIKAPCPPLFETISNECEAKKRGSMLLGMTDGKCAKETGQECITEKDCQLPMDYAVQSSCPYKAVCVDKSCVVVCPIINNTIND